MGTRSLIAKQTGPDTYRAIFCQLDGHLESQGAMLLQGLIDLVYLDRGGILVCNDEGKLIGMDGNRVLDNGTIIAGPFFIAGDAGENFCSLTDDQVGHFMQRFMEPEDISQEDVQADTGFIFYSF